MKKAKGITKTCVDGRFVQMNREFDVSSETRKRYDVNATSIVLEDDDSFVKIELNTADLIEALVNGGITADDLRFYADVADGVITSENPYVPGAITNEFE